MKYKIRRYTLLLIMLGVFIPLIGVTYSSFIISSDNYKASEMYIGKLLYSLEIDGEPVSSVSVPSGISNYTLNVSSLNTVATYFRVVNSINENIIVTYNPENNDAPSGVISNTKTITVQVENKSDSNIDVNFKVVAGYVYNGLEKIEIPEGYEIITELLIENDFNILALYVDGSKVDELDSTKRYQLIDYECSNDEIVLWDTRKTKIEISPINKATSCTLYFKELTLPLYDAILAHNTPYADNTTSEFVTGTTGINFGAISSDTNGKGLYYTEENTDEDGDGENERIYYFRGAVDNNYLVFAGYCWRIVRTNENGSIKLRYNGELIDEGSKKVCVQTGTSTVTIATSIKFNSTSTRNQVGYTFGDTLSALGVAMYGTTDSTIKGEIDTWYLTNIVPKGEGVTKLIANTIYCNDRSLASTSSGTTTIYYGAYERLISNDTPQYGCPEANNDGYTLSQASGGIDGYGNNLLTYPVALLTADEIAYAGGYSGANYKTHYIYTGVNSWTMTPYIFSSSVSRVFYNVSSGGVSGNTVGTSYAVIPAISLIPEAEVIEGSGLYDDPYIIGNYEE